MRTLAQLRGNKSQSDIAKTLGISKCYLSLLENGKRRMSLDIAQKLASIYGVTIDEIYNAYKVCIMSTKNDKNELEMKAV